MAQRMIEDVKKSETASREFATPSRKRHEEEENEQSEPPRKYVKTGHDTFPFHGVNLKSRHCSNRDANQEDNQNEAANQGTNQNETANLKEEVANYGFQGTVLDFVDLTQSDEEDDNDLSLAAESPSARFQEDLMLIYSRTFDGGSRFPSFAAGSPPFPRLAAGSPSVRFAASPLPSRRFATGSPFPSFATGSPFVRFSSGPPSSGRFDADSNFPRFAVGSSFPRFSAGSPSSGFDNGSFFTSSARIPTQVAGPVRRLNEAMAIPGPSQANRNFKCLGHCYECNKFHEIDFTRSDTLEYDAEHHEEYDEGDYGDNDDEYYGENDEHYEGNDEHAIRFTVNNARPKRFYPLNVLNWLNAVEPINNEPMYEYGE